MHGFPLELDFQLVLVAFAVEAAGAELKDWLQIRATDSNTLKRVEIPLNVARLIVKNARHKLGMMSGLKLVGIRSICLLKWRCRGEKPRCNGQSTQKLVPLRRQSCLHWSPQIRF